MIDKSIKVFTISVSLNYLARTNGNNFQIVWYDEVIKELDLPVVQYFVQDFAQGLEQMEKLYKYNVGKIRSITLRFD
jgi:hypothetical protein